MVFWHDNWLKLTNFNTLWAGWKFTFEQNLSGVSAPCAGLEQHLAKQLKNNILTNTLCSDLAQHAPWTAPLATGGNKQINRTSCEPHRSTLKSIFDSTLGFDLCIRHSTKKLNVDVKIIESRGPESGGVAERTNEDICSDQIEKRFVLPHLLACLGLLEDAGRPIL